MSRRDVTQSWPQWHREAVDVDQVPLDLGEAYRKYSEELIRFATGLVGPSDASDIVSGAIAGCIGSQSWSSVRDPRSYLFRCVLNEARQMRRTDLRRRAREARALTSTVAPGPDVRPEILAALAVLSIRQRAVVVLTYWDDLAPAAVATRLGIGEGSVRRHLARARKQLRTVLDVRRRRTSERDPTPRREISLPAPARRHRKSAPRRLSFLVAVAIRAG
jgi:RNA polymerase sigma factor (sigma-70 family)